MVKKAGRVPAALARILMPHASLKELRRAGCGMRGFSQSAQVSQRDGRKKSVVIGS